MSAKRKYPSASSKANGMLALNREQFIVFIEQSR